MHVRHVLAAVWLFPIVALGQGISLVPDADPPTPLKSRVEAQPLQSKPSVPVVGSMDEAIQGGDQGYWFYKNHPKAVPPEKPVQPPFAAPEKKLPPRCEGETTWTPDCGFVLPKSFGMQARERDALLQQMVMHPEDPENVKAVQEYTNWIFHQASYVGRVWSYNRMQDPRKFDPSATSPISAMGLRLASGIGRTDQKAVWQAVSDLKGFLVVFTKNDCDYCEAQVPALRMVAKDTGLPIWGATIGGPCLSFFGQRCMTVEQSTLPARILHVDLVPAVFLYLPDDVWIKVSAGLTASNDIEDRLYNLFISWKLAATKIAKGTGNTGLALDPDAMPRDTQALRRLLETSIPKQAGTKK